MSGCRDLKGMIGISNVEVIPEITDNRDDYYQKPEQLIVLDSSDAVMTRSSTLRCFREAYVG